MLGLSIGSTYFFCIRPMRKGTCAMTGNSQRHACGTEQETQAEAARLRREIATLRGHVGRTTSSR
ncbi:MAG: hypothetical protein EPN48_11655 [Microbacteriaceae bacterium]|nr:MAG: hypothetical protein EPN48_11655 [Microbacteriaceae bacterium]